MSGQNDETRVLQVSGECVCVCGEDVGRRGKEEMQMEQDKGMK
jgi:hypothetical protein